jgi:molybdopterin adenylyltransferase
MRAALITVSTSKSAGEDESGPRMRALVRRLGLEVAGSELIPDDRTLIEARLRHWSDLQRCALILTSGGTGLSPTDVTPEATRAVIEREAPGIAFALLDAARRHTRHWMLSRGIAGVRGETLIVNLPGAPASIDQAGEVLAEALPHALAILTGRPSAHG